MTVASDQKYQISMITYFLKASWSICRTGFTSFEADRTQGHEMQCQLRHQPQQQAQHCPPSDMGTICAQHRPSSDMGTIWWDILHLSLACAVICTFTNYIYHGHRNVVVIDGLAIQATSNGCSAQLVNCTMNVDNFAICKLHHHKHVLDLPVYQHLVSPDASSNTSWSTNVNIPYLPLPRKRSPDHWL